MELEPISI